MLKKLNRAYKIGQTLVKLCVENGLYNIGRPTALIF